MELLTSKKYGGVQNEQNKSGNIFVAGVDKEGNTASVADEDIKHIMMFLRYVFYFNKARIESFEKALK